MNLFLCDLYSCAIFHCFLLVLQSELLAVYQQMASPPLTPEQFASAADRAKAFLTDAALQYH